VEFSDRETPALLELRGLTVGIAGQELLKGLSCSLRPGQRIAFTGPSGCGKSTLLRTIAGLADPVRGAILFKGSPRESTGWPAFRRRVVYMAQEPALLDGAVGENLAKPFQYATSPCGFPERRAKELLDRLELEPHRFEQRAESLSAGQKQRVALVRALLLEPDALLLDEPASALDDEAAAAVIKLVREESEQRGLAAFVVSHDLFQVDKWCHEHVNLRPMAVAAGGPAASA